MTQSSLYPPAAADNSAPNAPHAASPALYPMAAANNALSAEPLDLVGLLAGAHHPGAGAVVLFSGEVRNSNKGLSVDFLEYEAYASLASKLIGEIVAAARGKWRRHQRKTPHRLAKVGVGASDSGRVTASRPRCS